MPNEFPAVWFDTFLSPKHAAPVERELAFIQRHLPASAYRRVLDVPCGIGRHSGPLSALGYEVLGIDRSEAALAVARQHYPGAQYRALDMFRLRSLGRTFDAVLCLWQSFGYGTSEQNRQLLTDMGTVLRPDGRMLLDIYNADAAAVLPRLTTEERGGRTVHTRRSIEGRHMRVELTYSDSGEVDTHEWEIFSPTEIVELAAEVGLGARCICAWFDETVQPSSEHLRMQVLLERLTHGAATTGLSLPAAIS